MADATTLLRLLEPAVRPVGVSPAARPAGQVPFESQSFDDLLADARLNPEPDEPQLPDAAATRSANPLAGLTNAAGFENTAVRSMLAEH